MIGNKSFHFIFWEGVFPKLVYTLIEQNTLNANFRDIQLEEGGGGTCGCHAI